MAAKKKNDLKVDNIHEPLSSFFPPPLQVEEPTLQNFAPPSYGQGGKYVNKEKKQETGELFENS